jgi:chlorophyll synthase
MFYSFAGLGIAIVNDFKSVQGDRELGLKSIPVMFGTTAAVWICALTIDLFQIGVAGYLISLQQNLYATILLLMVIPQITFQDMYLLRDPVNNDVKYQANAQPFLVLGILVTALAVGQNGGI